MAILNKTQELGNFSTLPYHWRRWFEYQSPRPKDYAKLDLGISVTSTFVTRFQTDGSFAWDKPPCGTSFWQERDQLQYEPRFGVSNNKWTLPTGPVAKLAYARAYSKFLQKAYQQAEWATSLAERRKSMSMMTSRLVQIHRALAALKRGRFKKFLQVLGVRPRWKDRSKAWSRPKQFSSLWLEYWFGWAPLINDVYVGLENQCTVIPPVKLRGGGQVPFSYAHEYRSGARWARTTQTGYVRCLITGAIEVTDQVLHDRNKLGLLNPARTALDLIPFSWFLNWFVNIQQFVSSLTDFAGLRLTRATLSFKTKENRSYSSSNPGSWTYLFRDLETVSYRRKPIASSELPKPKLAWAIPDLSPTRAATLIALIINQCAPGKKLSWRAYAHQ